VKCAHWILYLFSPWHYCQDFSRSATSSIGYQGILVISIFFVSLGYWHCKAYLHFKRLIFIIIVSLRNWNCCSEVCHRQLWPYLVTIIKFITENMFICRTLWLSILWHVVAFENLWNHCLYILILLKSFKKVIVQSQNSTFFILQRYESFDFTCIFDCLSSIFKDALFIFFKLPSERVFWQAKKMRALLILVQHWIIFHHAFVTYHHMSEFWVTGKYSICEMHLEGSVPTNNLTTVFWAISRRV